MQGNTATFGCTALVGTNKAGVLKPDANGYYEMVLGALNFYNSAGVLYVYEGTAKEIFKEGSSFMRRMAKAVMRGEYGHPYRDPGMTVDAYALRLMEIREDKVSHHIKEVRVDFTSVKDANGRPCIAIIGKIKPCGPFGEVLRKQIENPDENVCFSIRALTYDEKRGMVRTKEIREILTWDYVNEPGISVANKYAAPTLESYAQELASTQLTPAVLHTLRVQHEAQYRGMSVESDDNLQIIEEAMGVSRPRPASTRW